MWRKRRCVCVRVSARMRERESAKEQSNVPILFNIKLCIFPDYGMRKNGDKDREKNMFTNTHRHTPNMLRLSQNAYIMMCI